jgi:DNA-binding transcriptional MerR regulator
MVFNKGHKKYTINDLSELTGYSRRTIRYYIQEGLLDSPAGRGKGGFYFESHLLQLHLIKKLQESGMSLSSIAKYIEKGYKYKEKPHSNYTETGSNLVSSENLLPTAKKRLDMMKMKIDKILEKETLRSSKVKMGMEDFIFEENFYASPPKSSRDVWAKYEIAPGLEISVRRDIEEKQKRKIDDIIRVAMEILGKG